MFITKVISGGQTGADQGGLDAAIEMDIPHGGYCPKGRKCETGVIPYRYRLVELGTYAYRVRTAKNVLESDGTLIIANMHPKLSEGSQLTKNICEDYEKPYFCHDYPLSMTGFNLTAKLIREYLVEKNVKVLNVAGNRESVSPGIQEYTRLLLKEVLRGMN